MIKKEHRYILKAFYEMKIPLIIKEFAPQLIFTDSEIGRYCEQILKRKSNIKIRSDKIITEDEIKIYSNLINISTGIEKEEMVIYYRLLRLTESIIYYYRGTQEAGSSVCE